VTASRLERPRSCRSASHPLADFRPTRHCLAMDIWRRLLAWIDRGLPFLQSQQLLAIAPLAFTILVFPGAGTTTMFLAFGFWIACLGVFSWRMILCARRRLHVDGAIRRGLLKRLRSGRGLPHIGDR